MDPFTPYYLNVLPFSDIRNAINFFKDLNKMVNHTRFADAFYAPHYGSVVILEMVTKFYYDLQKEAEKGKYL